jgi:L-amino acid N-acyltransferase YncA
MPSHIEIDEMTPEDWPRVAEIYQAGIEGGRATFETSAPTWEQWDGVHLRAPRLVARADGHVVGWAALSAVARACAYRGVAEVSIYVDPASAGQGLGKRLLSALASASEHHGIWTLESWVFPENRASVRIHEACGFRRVGIRERIGRLNGSWRDVMILERRSTVVGAHDADPAVE